VRQSKNEGYTEPNPLINLDDTYVMRKILILSRETRYIKEMSDVSFNGFLPENIANAADNNIMFAVMLLHEDHFVAFYHKSNENGNRLKFFAKLNESNLSVIT
tara:strand:+ start:212 stop:520 length:309 start_codon:yes stop_codon:yes gene_type:complete